MVGSAGRGASRRRLGIEQRAVRRLDNAVELGHVVRPSTRSKAAHTPRGRFRLLAANVGLSRTTHSMEAIAKRQVIVRKRVSDDRLPQRMSMWISFGTLKVTPSYAATSRCSATDPAVKVAFASSLADKCTAVCEGCTAPSTIKWPLAAPGVLS